MLRWLPEDVSPYGAGIDSLFYFIYYITAAAFVVVTAVMVVFLYMYRHQEGRRAIYSHGHTGLELVWTIIPAIVFIGLGLASKAKWDEIKLTIPDTDTVIKLTGKQFNWEVLYPGPDGEFGTEDDYQVDNDVRIPVGKPVRVLLGSKDVVHSVFIPNLRFKQDTMPGREISAWFQADKPGRYEMPCAELCGFGHSGMVGWVYALEPDEYQQWHDEKWPQKTATEAAAPVETPKLSTPSTRATTAPLVTDPATTAPTDTNGTDAPSAGDREPTEAAEGTPAASPSSPQATALPDESTATVNTDTGVASSQDTPSPAAN